VVGGRGTVTVGAAHGDDLGGTNVNGIDVLGIVDGNHVGGAVGTLLMVIGAYVGGGGGTVKMLISLIQDAKMLNGFYKTASFSIH